MNSQKSKILTLKEDIEAFRTEFENAMIKPQIETLRENKFNEIHDFKPLYDKKYYTNLIYKTQDFYDINNLEIDLEYVETKEQNDIWQYLRIHTSSICGNQPVGRIIKLFVREKNTKKYLGLIGVSGDIRAMKERDSYIGWDIKTRNKNLLCISNMYCCVGLRPMSYNLNIGKLLAQIPFSKEFQEYYKDKYHHYIAGFITTSIDGKSIQYKDIDALSFLGYTEGYGTVHIPDNLYEKGSELLKKYDNMNTNNEPLYEHSKKVYKGKYPKMQRILKMLGLKKEYLKHNNQRGIYFGFTGNDSQLFLQGKQKSFTPKLDMLDDIVFNWRENHANKRHYSLFKRKKILTETELDWFMKKYNSLQSSKKYIENKKNNLGDIKYKQELKEYMKQYRTDTEHEKFTILDVDGDFEAMIDKEYDDFELTDSYLGGFFDGDGSIYIGKDLTLCVSFEQKWFPILYQIKKIYGGLYNGPRKKNNNSAPTYSIRITGQSCKKILNVLKDNCITKKEMISVGLTYFNTINKYNSTYEKQHLREQLSYLKTKIRDYTDLDLTGLNDEYMTGLFDAEGLVYLKAKTGTDITVSYDPIIIERKYSNFRLQITQLSSPTLIYAFVDKYKCGNATSKYNNGVIDDWRITKADDIRKIINILLQLSYGKKIQLKAFSKFLETVGNAKNKNDYDLDIHNIRKKCAQIIEDEKGLCWNMNKKVFTTKNHNQKKLNKLSCIKIQENKKEKKQKQGQEKINCEYCGNEMSKNAYKRHLNENCKENPQTKITDVKEINKIDKQIIDDKIISHAKKARTQYFKKRTYNDDNIRDIQQAFDDRKMNKKQLANKYKIDRNVIADIVSKKINPFDKMDNDEIDKYFQNRVIEKKQKKSNITNLDNEELKINHAQKTSLGKRSIELNDIIKILQYKGKFSSYKKMSEELKIKTNKGIYASEHICKAICGGRTQIFEEEFKNIDNMTYEKYLKIIKK